MALEARRNPIPMRVARASAGDFQRRMGQGLDFIGLGSTQITRLNDIIALGTPFSDDEGESRFPVLVFSAADPRGEVIFRIQREQMVEGELHQSEAISATTLDETLRECARILLDEAVQAARA